MRRYTPARASFGAELRRCRTSRRQSLLTLSLEVGVCVGFLSEQERGLKAPLTPLRLQSVIKALNLTPAEVEKLADLREAAS